MPLQLVTMFTTIHGGDMEMRLYYIAYQYQSGHLEMLDGPFGTASEAYQIRDAMAVDNGNDGDLKVVVQSKKVEIL
jgi:hypothetical protein